MYPSYKTIFAQSNETLFIKKSRFIGQAYPVSTEAEVTAYLSEIRKEHWDASHNCFAYVLGERAEIQKASDDGEPSGTAGRPMLDVLLKEEIRNALVIVTRYYGGIQLGAGGLVRAYSQSAQGALHAAEIVTRAAFRRIQVTMGYHWLGPVQHDLQARGHFFEPPLFSDVVTLHVRVPEPDAEAVMAHIRNLTHGQTTVELLELAYATVTENGKLRG